MTLKFHSSLLKDISSMLNAEDYNVIIQVGEANDTKKFHAHSNILRASSQYFKDIIPAGIIKKDSMFTVIRPQITPSIFEIILKYIYTGKLDLRNQSGADNFRLMFECYYLFLDELFVYVQFYLIEQQTPWIQQNFVLILNSIFNLPNYKKLQDLCIESICRNPLSFLTSNDFQLLNKYILLYFLKQDDFHGKNIEVIVWNSLIKWGIKQTYGLENKNNQKEWTDIDYDNLKNTLSIFIPYINFTSIPSEDFYDKVRPYEVIIPSVIYDEILAYYLIEQPKLCIYNSKIINPRFVNVISNLIDKKRLSCPSIFIRTEDDPIYRFKLFSRCGLDGVDEEFFQDKYEVANLILVKTLESDKIFAGYCSAGIGSLKIESICAYDDYRNYSPCDFVFSFKNDKENQNIKLKLTDSYFEDGSEALYGSSLYIISEEFYKLDPKNMLKPKPRVYTNEKIEKIETYAVVKPLKNNLKDMLSKINSNVNGNSVNY
ncbi:unnamed protein product [Rhizophagus irregularis]|uniref:BTB domain-containing protein n=1 Tax=Rhizophagus irregularis TaxID=588596 RepID=A0A2N1NN29_9GLOM|nr:hypothetical protein RhiirC2_773812 [Rhizophagus irregularis]CAB4385807.1 unnamed protein product [Rhizophagus irregularis]